MADIWIAFSDCGAHVRMWSAEGPQKIADAGLNPLRFVQADAATPPADAALGDAVAPGVMRCAKCKFGLQRVILSVRSGTASAGNSKTEPCPNGCGPLWPVTWKELAKEHLEVAERFFDESAVLRKDNETLRAELTALRARPQAVAEGYAIAVPVGHLQCWENELNSAKTCIDSTLAWVSEYIKNHEDAKAMLAASQSATGGAT